MTHRIRKQSYRGQTTFTLEYTDATGQHSVDFDTEADAKLFLNDLLHPAPVPAAVTEPPAPPRIPNGLLQYTADDRIYQGLEQLGASKEQLATLLNNLAQAGLTDLARFATEGPRALTLTAQLQAALPPGTDTIETLIPHLQRLQQAGATLGETWQAYEKVNAAKKELQQSIKTYLAKQLQDLGDEDEVALIEKRLTRFLEAFQYTIDHTSEDDIDTWIARQPGSMTAKARYQETISQFLTHHRRTRPQRHDD